MSEQTIEVGQVWKRKKNGKLIRITRQRIFLGEPDDDWVWEGVDYKGKGVSYGSYIRRDLELVSEAGSTDG